ncbi:MAG: VWA domain-containing protein [Sphingomonadaceae bacterium]|nr:VWA domain-containing protein [Sphingomonadaceae bacterium]
MMRKLARDTAGNTLALLAAAILPLLGIVGGGVDMGRAYLAESRLQQACDAGVLAARKKLGTTAPVTGAIPSDVSTLGNRFFNINYRSGIYGTENRQFRMTMNNDYSIDGRATVDVPTTIMGVFGFDKIPVVVECEANLNFSALDVMMVLDVTGSMRHTNAGDTLSRMDSMKQVIRNFYAELETSKAPGSEVRYGFVPYASNVNVGHLLEDDWVADSWTYQSRIDTGVNKPAVNKTYYRNWAYKSGALTDWSLVNSYPATYYAAAGADQSGYYKCEGTQPAPTWVESTVKTGTRTEVQTSPYLAVLTIESRENTYNGTRYRTVVNGSTCNVEKSTATSYVETYEFVTEVPSLSDTLWKYQPVTIDTSNWRNETKGCIEERATYNITDFNNVDLSKALDLDIDRVPTAGSPDTQWKAHYPAMIYVRKIMGDGSGTIWKPQATTAENYADTGNWWFSDCPAPAKKLTPMTSSELDDYLAKLTPYSATYHDIGMIWGARLISPKGLFSAENGVVGGRDKTRHLIFLTDGQTEPYDLAYGAYGVDALDQRRWDSGNALTLAQTIEQRFKFACTEVKKRNVTVWVIAFGTYANQAMIDCAGNGRYFEASNAKELNDAFISIARSMSDLRLTD